jgi:hypothetical protein
MFASLTAARSELEAIALDFDASAFAGNEALRARGAGRSQRGVGGCSLARRRRG